MSKRAYQNENDSSYEFVDLVPGNDSSRKKKTAIGKLFIKDLTWTIVFEMWMLCSLIVNFY